MREYGQVQSAFWESPDARAMSDQGKLLCNYLLSGPKTNGLGCFRLGDGQLMDDLGWMPDKTEAAFAELSRNGWAYRFEGVVLIPKFLKWNKIANANVAKARFGDFDMLPKGKVKAFAARAMLEFCDHWQPETAAILETVSETVTGTVYESLNQTPENQNPTQPYHTQPYPTPLVRKPARAKKAAVSSTDFDRFYDAYPRKISRSSAAKAFAKIAPSPELLKTIMTALARQAATPKWRNEPQYIPHPATWLNQSRWEDDIFSITTSGRAAPAPSKTITGIQALEELKNANLDRARDSRGLSEAHDLELGSDTSQRRDQRHRDGLV